MAANSAPAFSVIIPLYNKAAHILRCLASVRAQTFTDYEIIVVDDGSSDDGAEIARRNLGGRDRLIAQANAGAGAARNRGIAAMRGRLAAFLDADDAWLPEHLADLHALAKRFPQAALLATGFACQSLGGMSLSCRVDSDEPQLITDYFDRCRDTLGVTNSSSCAMRRDALDAIGGFAEGIPRGEDLDLFARLALHWPVALHPAVSTITHLFAENRSERINKYVQGFPAVVETLAGMLARGEVTPALESPVRAYVRYCIIKTLDNALLSRDIPCVLGNVRHPYIAQFGLEHEARALRLKARWLPLPVVLAAHRLRSLRWLVRPVTTRHGMRIAMHRSPLAPPAGAPSVPQSVSP